MEAIVLGGAANTGPIREVDDTPYEAGIKINNRPMVEFVLDVLEEMEEIQRIAVVVPEGIIDGDKWSKVKIVPPGVSMIDSLIQAVDYLHSDGHLLVLASDIPLITKEALRDFLANCAQKTADIYYSFVPKSVIEEKYPETKRTYVHLKEGIVTGGNVVLMEAKTIHTYKDRLQQAIALRKHPLKLCRLLGIKFLFKLMTGSLRVTEIESRVEEIVKVKGAGVISLFPEIKR